MSFEFYIFISFQLFFISLIGIVFNQNHVLFTLMSLEILLISASLLFVLSSMCFNDITGQIFVLFLLTVTAAESTIGLVLFILFFKLRGTIDYVFLRLIYS